MSDRSHALFSKTIGTAIYCAKPAGRVVDRREREHFTGEPGIGRSGAGSGAIAQPASFTLEKDGVDEGWNEVSMGSW